MRSDSELIEEILNNNPKAFEELVLRYQPLVAKTCLGFVNSHADAEDLTQEVFLEVYQSLPKFRGQSQFSTWLYRISVNKSLNFIRQQKRHKGVRSIEFFFTREGDTEERELPIAAPQADLTDWPLEQKENKKILKLAINGLPKNQRTAFVLSKYQQMGYKEIAQVMDMSLSAVESLLFRARRNLQKTILKELKR